MIQERLDHGASKESVNPLWTNDSLVPLLQRDPSDLGSLILIWIIPGIQLLLQFYILTVRQLKNHLSSVVAKCRLLATLPDEKAAIVSSILGVDHSVKHNGHF